MRYYNILKYFILLTIFIGGYSISIYSTELTDQLYYITKQIDKEANKYSILKSYLNKSSLSKDERNIILKIIGDTALYKNKDYNTLVLFSILANKTKSDILVNYYLDKAFSKAKTFEERLYIFLRALQFGAENIEKYYNYIQVYRLTNDYNNVIGLGDLIFLFSNDNQIEEKSEYVISLDESRLGYIIYKFITDIFKVRVSSIKSDLVDISYLLKNDFLAYSVFVINSVNFIFFYVNLLLIVLSFIIFFKHRKEIYHSFLHYLPRNASIGYHRIYSILGLGILYYLLGIYGIIILFGVLIARKIILHEKIILGLTGIFILLTILVYQFLYIYYIPLKTDSVYQLYYRSYQYGFDEDLYAKIEEKLEESKHPLLLAALAYQEKKRGDYIASLKLWDQFENAIEEKLPEVEANKANDYFFLNNYTISEKLYKQALNRKFIPEVYYNMAKLKLNPQSIDIEGFESYWSKIQNMESFVKNYIFLTSKFLGVDKPTAMLDIPLPKNLILDFIYSDFKKYLEKTKFDQIISIIKLIIVIWFIVYIFTAKKKYITRCKICGMEVCYKCKTEDGFCPICGSKIEAVESHIMKNKLKLELKENSKRVEYILRRIIVYLIPGSYNLLENIIEWTTFVKIAGLVFLWTLFSFRFEYTGVYIPIYELKFWLKFIVIILLLVVYIVNYLRNRRKYIKIIGF